MKGLGLEEKVDSEGRKRTTCCCGREGRVAVEENDVLL